MDIRVDVVVVLRVLWQSGSEGESEIPKFVVQSHGSVAVGYSLPAYLAVWTCDSNTLSRNLDNL